MLFRTQKRMYCVVQKQRRGGIVLFQGQRRGGSVWSRDAGEKVLSFQKQRTDDRLGMDGKPLISDTKENRTESVVFKDGLFFGDTSTAGSLN